MSKKKKNRQNSNQNDQKENKKNSEPEKSYSIHDNGKKTVIIMNIPKESNQQEQDIEKTDKDNIISIKPNFQALEKQEEENLDSEIAEEERFEEEEEIVYKNKRRIMPVFKGIDGSQKWENFCFLSRMVWYSLLFIWLSYVSWSLWIELPVFLVFLYMVPFLAKITVEFSVNLYERERASLTFFFFVLFTCFIWLIPWEYDNAWAKAFFTILAYYTAKLLSFILCQTEFVLVDDNHIIKKSYRNQIPSHIKKKVKKIVKEFNEENFSGSPFWFEVSFENQFLYLDFFEKNRKRPRAKLEYTGRMDDWGFAIFKYSSDQYDPEERIFPGSQFLNGTIEGALRAALEAYPPRRIR